MAQFDVYENPDPHTQAHKPFFIDVQTDLLQDLSTRVVVPLITDAQLIHPIELLNPELSLNNCTVYLSTAELRSIPRQQLGRKIANLRPQRQQIESALGVLVSGIE